MAEASEQMLLNIKDRYRDEGARMLTQVEWQAINDYPIRCRLSYMQFIECINRTGRVLKMEPIIRPFRTSDYHAVLTIMKAAVPEVPVSEEQLREGYENMRFGRCVVVTEGNVVAYGKYIESANTGEFNINGAIHPDYQFNGIGTALYNYIIATVRQFNPLLVQAYALENKSRSIEFLKARGFQEVQQGQNEYHMFGHIASFESQSSSEIEENLQNQGITIKTLKELQSETNFAYKLYALYHELIQQTPGFQLLSPKMYAEFVRELTRLDLLSEAYNIALHEGKYIGMNALYKTPGPEVLFNEFTGVKQEYRKRGIAKALKLRGIAYAKAHGYSTITTRNNIRNGHIVQLNKQLGFVAMIKYVKVFQ